MQTKMCFRDGCGQFRLTRLGQGCTNSPAVFCRLMAMVLRGLTCCLAYIDDTICFSSSFEGHLADLEVVFDRFRQADLKLKATKCKLFQTRCKFVGHYVSEDGIEVDPVKVACVVNWQFPKTITELRGFLGLCSYYRSFCKGFASIAEPLTECLRKNVALTQTRERLAAFNELKKMLTSAPVLAMPRDDPDCTYVIDCDASGTGAGCVLSQWQDGKLRVIEYASRTFNAAERIYCATRRELAALIFGLKQFRSYLLGRRFQVRVDNMAIRYYKNMKDVSGQCARHLDFMSNFDFEIIHRNGAKHVNCDSLSRLRPCEIDDGGPCSQCNRRITGQHRIQAVKTDARHRRAARSGADGTAESTINAAVHAPASDDSDVATREEASPVRNRRVPRRYDDFLMAVPPRNRQRSLEETACGTAVSAPDVAVRPKSRRGSLEDTASDAAVPHVTAAVPNTPLPDSFRDTNVSKTRRRRRRRQCVPSVEATAPTAFEAGVGDWSPDVVRDMQLRDGDIAPAMAWLESGVRPPWADVQACSPMLRALWQQYDSLSIRNGVLCRCFYDDKGMVTWYQLVLPAEMKVPFLELIHADTAGHLKYAKCIPHIMRRAWWLSWKRDLNLFIRCCAKCEGFHRGQPPRQAHLRPMIVGAPGERFAIDLCGPFPSSNGYKYLFTAICVFSKFGICVPIRNKEASTVARALVDHVFLKYGLCSEILTDLGLEFQNELMQELLSIFGVAHLRTSGYRPQTNGVCEVWHRTLNAMIAKLVDEGQRDWSSLVPYVTFCYNATEHTATGFSPFFIFTGRTPLWTVDLVLPELDRECRTVPEYATAVVDRLEKASALVRENLRKAATSASNWYNNKARPKSFTPGDNVRIYYPRRYPGRTPKWQSFYRTEGCVLKKLNDATYIVSSANWKGPKIVHVDKLKLVNSFTGQH